MIEIKLHLLGSPYLTKNGQAVEMDTRKALALLAYLAVNGGAHSRESLAVLLWPDYDEAGARGAFRRTLSTLNTALGEGVLEISRESVAVSPTAGLWVDVEQFHGLLAACTEHPHPKQEVCADCLPVLLEAVALARGDFLQGFSLRDSANFDDWQFFQTEEIHQALAGALERLARLLVASGDYDSAINHARRWLAMDPLREEAHRLLMRLYAWSGQRNAALRQYRECVRIMQQEISVAPMEETQQLYQQILEGQLAPPPLLAPQGGPAEISPAVRIRKVASGGVQVIRQEAAAGAAFPLIGRAAEWQTLVLCHAAAQQRGWLMLLEGEAGIGKTRLAEDFLAHAQSLGARVFQARGYEGETNLAYGPFIEGLSQLLKDEQAGQRLSKLPSHWLGEAARLLPEIASLFPDLPSPTPLDSPGAQTRFFEGLRQVLAQLLSGQVPGVLMLDDLHWADTASLELLTYIARRLEHSGYFLLLTWRGGQSENRTQILQLLTEAQRRKRGTRLHLGRWSEADVLELVKAWQGEADLLGEQFTQRLYQESEGLPLYLISFLNSFHQTPPAEPGSQLELPADVRNLWQAQISGLDEISQQLLSTAAVIGHSFDYLTLKEASGRSELEALNGLEKLLEAYLIHECNQQVMNCESSYDFTHERLRELVYQEISLARKQLMHRRTAEALLNAARGRKEQGKITSQVAYHYQQAGQNNLAAEYFKQAGEQARSLYANAAALAHFEAALTAGYPDAAALHETIGDLVTLSGDYRAAINHYETAAALCLPSELARIEHKLGEVYSRKGEWQCADSYFQVALEDLEKSDDPSLRARILADWSLTAHRLREDERALAMARQSLDLAQKANDLHALAQAYNMLGMLARRGGDFEEALSQLNSSLQIAQRLAEPERQAAALNNLALVHGDKHELDQAISLTQQALSLCVQQGDRHREAALLNNLADLYHAAGLAQEAQEYLHRSVVLFAEIGERDGGHEPEIWKLSEW